MDLSRECISINVLRGRNRLGLTQSELAEKAELSLRMIQKVEYRQVSPSIEALEKIARAIGVPISDLFLDPSTKLTTAPKGTSTPDLAGLEFSGRVLGALSNLSPVRQAIVLALVFDDESYLDNLPDDMVGDFAQPLEQLLKAL